MGRIYAGIDVGASSTDVVLLNDEKRIIAYSVLSTGPIHQQTSDCALQEACRAASCTIDDLVCILGTGYGRKNIRGAANPVTEIACHAKGARYYFADVRTIVDIGGQDSKVIKVDERGNVIDFAMNEKCAAGTGRFLEAMARTLQVDLDRMGELSFSAKTNVRLSSVCTVFAESEVISKIAEGQRVEDLLKGIHNSICDRTMAMLERIKVEPAVAMTGGVAKNQGIVSLLQARLHCTVHVPEEPQIVGALGAALFAREKAGA